jgi:hypothetical protein
VALTRVAGQLKEEEMQRREAEDKASHQQDTINSMQAQLDKEDADLNEARLSLADSHLSSSARADPAQAAGDVEHLHALAAEALNEAEPARRPRPGGASKGGSSEPDSEYSESRMRDSLDEQRRDDARLAEEEADAHRRAHAEEAKLKAAQEQVASQLRKVTNLEGSMQ